MPVVNGTSGNDFIHRAGDGRTVPAGHADITGVTTGDDTIYGLGGNDYLFGDLGNDILSGGTGADRMDGGAGNDWFYVDTAADTVIEAAGGGSDRILSSVSYALAAGAHVEILTTTNTAGTAALNLYGNSFVQTIHGNAGANTLNGGGGADTLVGFGGNDIYYVDTAGDVVTEAAGGGIDRVFATVSYALNSSTQIETLSAVVAAATTAINLTGNNFAQTLTGNAGANILNGGGGADTMIGYGGNDWYYVDQAGDVVTEGAGGGSDRILTSVSYALAAAAQIEILTTTNTAGTGAINLTGNDFSQHILGNAGTNTLEGRGGNDILDGGAGADTLIGGQGNDTYVVDHVGDATFEVAGAGTDLVRSSITRTLGSDLENLVLTGSAAINGTGNALANSLTGNSGANILDGGGGNDVLNGGAGDDQMTGGVADDTYVVDSAGDVVTEAYAEGTDTVLSYLASYTLGDFIENGTVARATGGTLTGNALGNLLTGGAGNDLLLGEAGDDHLVGGGGNDELFAGGEGFYDPPENNTLEGGSGNDILHGAPSATLSFSGGDDILNGGAGDDTMYGLSGNDTYYVNSVGDVVSEEADAGFDTVHVSVNGYTLGDNVEYGVVALGTGLTLTGNSTTNTLEGGGGNDTLYGGDGNDDLSGNGGNDTLDGGAGDDDLRGNDGNDVMHGGAGNDEFYDLVGTNVAYGGAGDDRYTIETNGSLQIVENAGEGIDTVQIQVFTYTLPDNVEIGALAIVGGTVTGNASNNTLYANSGNDVLNGAGGNDILWGYSGADQLTGGSGSDQFDYNYIVDSTTASWDVILDLVTQTDFIDVWDIDANTGVAGNQSFNWVALPSGAAGEAWAVWDGTYTQLYFDVNGGGADMRIDVLGDSFSSGNDIIL
ncbi:calcium-binding protein [Sphingomonas sp.]|uniref:beta strand repeat-containing protein n=1 Tax=Sphingomonas sp. TaxID=28214 RepID=UPI00286D942F|nr:calcium-binding protein [Sphingomonas sp.]